ncbi:uncharacterized protein LOC112542829, partial [Python bivittatus]|uniref:Uncharacterized protein LOC112542829 n=1 Tax=Python bivittatus TaxID=176946 RepID=A0A9F5N1H4_PYTBI
MNQQLLLLSEENEEAKKLPSHLNGGQQMMKGNIPQAKVKTLSQMAVQAHIEDIREREEPRGMVHIEQRKGNKSQYEIGSIQPQRDEREVQKMPIEAQKIEQNMPSITVDVQQQWNHNGTISSVSVKMVQQNVKKEILAPCVTMQLEEKSLGREMSPENIHWQFSNGPKKISPVKQQAQHGEEVIAAEIKQQQAQEGRCVMDSKRVQQEAKDSILKETLPQQLRWNQSSKQLMLENLLQTKQKENKLKKIVTEKKLHNETQNAESTRTLSAHLWNKNEEDSKKPSLELLQKNVSDQQLFSLDKGAQNIFVEEKEYGHKEQIIYKKQKRDVPNYFVAIPITNDQILDKIEDVQEFIFTQVPKLLKALVPIETMHLTIIVIHLKTEDDIKRAISALERSKAEMQALLQRELFTMTFRGIGQFNNKVIYVKMSADEQQMLSKIAGIVANSFMEMNVDITSSRDFKPHLTFLKLSKAPVLRQK